MWSFILLTDLTWVLGALGTGGRLVYFRQGGWRPTKQLRDAYILYFQMVDTCLNLE